MAYDGSLKFDTKIDQKGFTNGVASIKSLALKAISAVGIALSAGAIAQAMIQIGKQGIELASNLQEVQNVIDVTFGDGAAQVNDFAKSAVTSYGLSELAAKKYTGTMGAMLKSMGLSSDAVQNMSTSMTGLAGDFASFFNITSEEAFDKIRAGIAGETEPLRQLGINMSVANLEAYALSQGIDKTYASMTQAEQATLRYNYLMSVSSDAQGDFARTSDSYANSQRLAALAVDELKTAIGNRLLPIATKMQGVIRDLALEAATAFDERGIAGIVDMITDKFPVATAAVSGLAAAFGALLIIKTLTPLVVAFQAAQVQVALAMMGTTAAAVAESGALTLFEVVVAIVTGKLKGAAAAQALFNAAIAANPVMLAVIAIGALVGATVLLHRTIRAANPDIVKLGDELKTVEKRNDDLVVSMENSQDAFEQTNEDIDEQEFRLSGLVGELQNLSAAYDGNAGQQARMDAIVAELNSSVDGLTLSYDRQTGALNMTTEAINAIIDAKIREARANAAMERYTEILTEQFDAERNLYDAQRAQSNFLATLTENQRKVIAKREQGIRITNDEAAAISGVSDQYLTYQRAVEKAAKVYEESGDAVAAYSAFLDESGISADIASESIDGFSDSVEAAGEATTRIVLAGEDVTQVLEDTGTTADDAAARLDNFTGAATNMFERISTRSKYTVKQMIANLVANTATIEQWGENIAILGDKLPESLLQPLIDQGPDKMAGVVQTLAKASDEELAALIDAFAKGGDAAKQAWLGSLGAGTDTPAKGRVSDQSTAQYGSKKDFINDLLGAPAQEIASSTVLSDASTTAVENSKEAMTQAVEDSDFGEVGKEITSAAAENLTGARQLFYDAGRYLMMGFIIGMLSRKAEIEADARMLARAASDAFHDALILGSPSKLTYQYGVFFAKGFSNALYDQKSNVKLGAGNLALASLSGFRSKLLLPSGAAIYGSSAAERAATAQTVSGGTTINAPITVQGVVESDAKLARRVRNEFQEVVLYGNR